MDMAFIYVLGLNWKFCLFLSPPFLPPPPHHLHILGQTTYVPMNVLMKEEHEFMLCDKRRSIISSSSSSAHKICSSSSFFPPMCGTPPMNSRRVSYDIIMYYHIYHVLSYIYIVVTLIQTSILNISILYIYTVYSHSNGSACNNKSHSNNIWKSPFEKILYFYIMALTTFHSNDNF